MKVVTVPLIEVTDEFGETVLRPDTTSQDWRVPVGVPESGATENVIEEHD